MNKKQLIFHKVIIKSLNKIKFPIRKSCNRNKKKKKKLKNLNNITLSTKL